MKNPIIPAGSVILTPEEVARLRDLISVVAALTPGPLYRQTMADLGREIKDILDGSTPLEGEQ